MPLARINNRLLHFVHIPKTGGCSITDYMRKKGKLALHSREKLDWGPTTPQHMEFATNTVLLPDGFADESFAIIRDPIERLISEYRYRATRYDSGAKVSNVASEVDRKTVELDWEETFLGTFDEWVDVVFERCFKDPRTCDNHIRPQSDFIGPNSKIFIFEEGLERVFRWIDRVTETKCLTVPLDRNESNKFAIEVSDQTRIKIKAFYKTDYTVINSLNEVSISDQITGDKTYGTIPPANDCHNPTGHVMFPVD